LSEQLTVAEFARRAGVDGREVRRALGKGLIAKGANGLLDAAQLSVSLRKPNRRTTIKATRTIEAVPADSDENIAEAVERIVATGGAQKLSDAIALKETYAGLLRQLEYDLKAGRVVLITDVAKVVGECLAKVRNRLLAMPSNIAPRLLRLTTAMAVEAEVRSAVIEALEELSTID
jgi:hypothetical protein